MTVFQNQALHTALFKYTVEARIAIEKFKKSHDISQRISETWERVDPRFFSKKYVVRDDIRLGSDVITEILQALNSFKDCKNILLEDTYTQNYNDQMVGTKFGGYAVTLYGLINNILRKVLDSEKEFGRDFFDELYTAFEADLYSTTVEKEALIPIQGIILEHSPLQIEKNIFLVDLSDVEKSELLSLGFRFGNNLLTNGIEDERIGAIRIIEEDQKVFGNVERRNFSGEKWEREKWIWIVFALHLCSKGKIDTLGHVIRSQSMFFPGTGFQIEIHPRTSFRTYEFKESIRPRFAKIWTFVKDLFNQIEDYQLTILYRFRNAIQRNSAGDRIIDLMTLLEGILVEDSKGIGYKLAERGAFLLAHETSERIKTFKRLKFLYRIRSQIVHGDELKGVSEDSKSPDSIWNLADELEEYARRIILIRFKFFTKEKKIDWDQIIFGNAKFLEDCADFP